MAGNMSGSHQHDWVTQGQMLLDQRFTLKAAVSNVHGGKKDAGNRCAAPPVTHGHHRPPNRLRARAGGRGYRREGQKPLIWGNHGLAGSSQPLAPGE